MRFFFFFNSPPQQQMCQIWVCNNFVQHEMKYGTWFMDEQDTRQNIELKNSVVQSVLLCQLCLFMYILTSKYIKNGKKKLSIQKKKKIKAWILLNQMRTEKQTRAAALRHTIYLFIFFALFESILWFFSEFERLENWFYGILYWNLLWEERFPPLIWNSLQQKLCNQIRTEFISLLDNSIITLKKCFRITIHYIHYKDTYILKTQFSTYNSTLNESFNYSQGHHS